MEEPSTPSTSKTAEKSNKRKRNSIDNEVMGKAMAELNKPYDEFAIFGEYVGSEIRSLHFDHNKRKLKRTIQKAILEMAEIDESERSSSTHSTQSVHSKDTDESNNSICSPPPSADESMHTQLQTTHSFPNTYSTYSYDDSNSSTIKDFQELGKSDKIK